MTDEYKGAIRQIPLKIMPLEDKTAWKDMKTRWLNCSQHIQRLLNRYWFEWKAWHITEGNDAKVRQWMADLSAWHNADSKTRGKKPNCPVKPMPSSCAKHIYAVLKSVCGGLNSRSLVLAMNKEAGDLASRVASKSAFKRWQRALCDMGEMPTYSRPVPIPFDKANGKAYNDGEHWRFQFRVDRFPTTTKKGKPKAESHLEDVRVMTSGRKGVKLRRILEKVESGDCKFCGSNLVERDGQWYIHLCYRERKDEAVEVDPNKTLVLRPAKTHPFSGRSEGRSFWIMGKGALLKHVRAADYATNRTRNESFRYGSKSRRGHGRNRAVYPTKNNVANFKKTFNQQAVAQVVRIAIDRGCGRIAFRQPTAIVERSRFLATSGNEYRRSPDSWPWYQIETLLKNTANRAGIEVVSTGSRKKKRPQRKTKKGVTTSQV